MKKQAYTMIAMIVLFGCMAVSAKAQCGDIHQIVRIPFQFNVGQTMLPAGEYRLSCLDENGSARTWQLQSTNGKLGVPILMISVEGASQNGSRLVFRRYGSRYFFAQAWASGSSTGRELPKSRAERRVEREFAGIKPKAETIALKVR